MNETFTESCKRIEREYERSGEFDIEQEIRQENARWLLRMQAFQRFPLTKASSDNQGDKNVV